MAATALGAPARRIWPIGVGRVDLVLVILLSMTAMAICLFNGKALSPQVYDTFNIYFQADPPRVISNMTERWSPYQNRTVAHPLFSITALSSVKALALLGLPPMQAIGLLLMLAAAVSAGGFHVAMRLMGLAPAAAAGFTLALLASAGFLHWYAFIETYAFSATGIVLMLIFTCSMRSLPRAGWIVASAASVAMLITNWGLGLAAAFFRLPFRQFLLVSGGAFLLVSAVSAVQMKLLHRAAFWLDPRIIVKEKTYAGPKMHAAGMAWHPSISARNALLMPGVVPSPQRADMQTEIGSSTVVTNQFAPLGQWGVAGGIAAAAWLVLLAGGVAGTLADRQRRPIGLALGLFLASKILFHSVYGEITFLYAADIAVAALAFAALGWFSPYRKAVVGALILFIAVGSIHNERQFLTAAKLSNQIALDKQHGRASGI
ncbi:MULTISPECIES: hypothetical protein [Sphingobium]|jgi:hypothetical protein|uniref:Uncharacterized protein n=2 Tax=Sphingobium fuliginis (strain ATCC 27551) TaxID=336203 RepID=A0A7M2GLC1_SPHSA|nr:MULTISPECIES: hypothetical protein [Sphingobium]AJR23916.1 hypothetical protein TZ53_09460 [Sphingobium sp. YBL2]QDC40089.1 hypothetical protein FIL70_23620 [Sphingobium fuliginis ATCC 27551]QOT73534.1 hypothetical protein H5V43_20205 [Sphingobium fuliginis]UXC92863.1 hypothetical protein EGM87_21395 [Sphingobium sp. RSMS]